MVEQLLFHQFFGATRYRYSWVQTILFWASRIALELKVSVDCWVHSNEVSLLIWIQIHLIASEMVHQFSLQFELQACSGVFLVFAYFRSGGCPKKSAVLAWELPLHSLIPPHFRCSEFVGSGSLLIILIHCRFSRWNFEKLWSNFPKLNLAKNFTDCLWLYSQTFFGKRGSLMYRLLTVSVSVENFGHLAFRSCRCSDYGQISAECSGTSTQR